MNWHRFQKEPTRVGQKGPVGFATQVDNCIVEGITHSWKVKGLRDLTKPIPKVIKQYNVARNKKLPTYKKPNGVGQAYIRWQWAQPELQRGPDGKSVSMAGGKEVAPMLKARYQALSKARETGPSSK